MTNIDSRINALDQQIRAIEDSIKAKVESIAKRYEARFNEAEGNTKNMKVLYKAYFQEIKETTSKENEAIVKLYEQRSKIIEATLKNIENKTNEFSKTTTQIIKQNFEEQKKFIEENVKDEKRKNELLLGIQKEFDKKMNDQLKKTLAGENQTVFEKLNERFAEEIQLYEKGSEEAIAIEKAFNRERRKLILSQSQQLISSISNLVNLGDKQLKEIEDTWGVTNQAAHDYGRAVGYNADQIKRLHSETLDWMSDNDISKQFNIGVEDMFKLMGSYNKELGRAVALTNESKINLVSLKNVIGEESAIKFTANLDKFGLDVDAAKELVEGIVGDGRRSGLVLSNLSENVANNLHLAQQYTFEDGIDGLIKMAEKATAVKWNMEQTAAFAEKVNNVEGAIKTGAQLSVLGGPFAQFSNPMGMLYESLNDMEGLQDRLFAMFGSLGEWNQEKGMLDISAFDKLRIKTASSAMGLNYGDVINNVQSQARRNVVKEQIKGLGLDNNTTELIANTAQIDRESGRAYVNYGNEKIFVNEISGKKNKGGILSYLEKQANSSDENLRDIAHNTLGAMEGIKAIEAEWVTDRADTFKAMGVTKENLSKTHEIIMKTKYGLDKISDILMLINTSIGLIGAMRGFGGSRGNAFSNTSLKQHIANAGGGAKGIFKGTGRWMSGNVAKYGGIGMGIGVAGAVGSHLMNKQVDRLREKGLYEDADKVNTGAGILGGATAGAAALSFLGPWGWLIGGVGGGILGGISASNENKRIREEGYKNIREQIYEITNVRLVGDYSEKEAEKIRRGTNFYTDEIREMMTKRGDGEAIDKLPPRAFARGGIIEGSSHAEGGLDVVDYNSGKIVANIEGGEGVIPKNVMDKFGTTDNLINNAMKPLQPMGETLQVNSIGNSNNINSSLNVGGSANVNVNGSIQLAMPNGQTYNITNDPIAMRAIGDNVMKHIMATSQQIFNKSNFYRKM